MNMWSDGHDHMVCWTTWNYFKCMKRSERVGLWYLNAVRKVYRFWYWKAVGIKILKWSESESYVLNRSSMNVNMYLYIVFLYCISILYLCIIVCITSWMWRVCLWPGRWTYCGDLYVFPPPPTPKVIYSLSLSYWFRTVGAARLWLFNMLTKACFIFFI